MADIHSDPEPDRNDGSLDRGPGAPSWVATDEDREKDVYPGMPAWVKVSGVLAVLWFTLYALAQGGGMFGHM
ncbi:MAG: hypothetical protein J2P57_14025 [Acidimicrobiaceae bacterium]|nr:hypothetical protein [Acidimicrobiaceae bacterium]